MRSPKKIALWFLIASVLLSAALGIIAILSGNFGELEIKIVLTTVTISAASICALADAALWESRKSKALPLLGLALTLLAAAMIICCIWLETAERFVRLTIDVSVLAVATSHLCLLSLAKLSRHFAWARVAAFFIIYSLAVLIIVVTETDNDGTKMIQAIGVNSILVAAISIVIPVFHRLSAAGSTAERGKVSAEETELKKRVLCPNCGTEQLTELGEITCQACHCQFVLKILTVPTA